MKKYCLTDCAKAKLTKTKENFITFLGIVGALILVGIGLAIILYVLGHGFVYLIELGIMPEPAHPFKNVFDAGISGLALVTLVGILGSLVYHISNSIKNTIMKIYTKDYSECKIFEECKKD